MAQDCSPDFVTEATLDAALPHILAAPKTDAPIHGLCYRADFRARTHPDHLTLCPDRGVIGDRWSDHAWLRLPDGRPDPRIQVCILPHRVWDLTCNRPGMPHPGDTLIADLDMSEANLPAGSLLKAGSAVLRVSDVFNDACVKWRARHGDASYRWINRPEHRALRLRGILCAIEQKGEIRRSDLLKTVPNGMESL